MSPNRQNLALFLRVGILVWPTLDFYLSKRNYHKAASRSET